MPSSVWNGYLFLCFLLLQILVVVHLQRIGMEMDIGWEFESNGNEGWGNATSEEMRMQLYLENGELRGIITGTDPSVDSPVTYIETTRRHYAVIRMKYHGEATEAHIMCRGGSDRTSSFHLDTKTSYWGLRHDIKTFMSSSGYESVQNLIDLSPYTKWTTSRAFSEYVILDIGDVRWINTIIVQSDGTSSSPRNCILQSSSSTGAGPFKTVASFGLSQNSEEQIVSGFTSHARYYRLYIVDNFGHEDEISIRKVSLEGYNEYTSISSFEIDNTGDYKTYYVPIHKGIGGILLRMKLILRHRLISVRQVTSHIPTGLSIREGLGIDYFRLVRAPEVWSVRGCLDVYYDNPNMYNPQFNVETTMEMINGYLELNYFEKKEMILQYATTYDCPLLGNVLVRLDGLNFGEFPRVYIGENECTVVNHSYRVANLVRIETIECLLPPGDSGYQNLRVENGVLPGLFQELPNSLSYRVAPPTPLRPYITNVGAHKVDLIWKAPGSPFENMMVTGYKILWFENSNSSRVSNLTVGNITTTSVRGLKPGTEYVFAIAAISEGVFHEKAANLPTDLYGRRTHLSSGLLGSFSAYTNSTATTEWDFSFKFFDANSTVNSSSAYPGSSLSVSGQYGSEGHYGLNIIGSAHIQNCNTSHVCCDGFNPSIGAASCKPGRSVCVNFLTRQLEHNFVLEGVSRRQVPSNKQYSTGGNPEVAILSLEEARQVNLEPNAPCGPGLFLTPSQARHSGAIWYPRKMNVGEGFDARFEFEISLPSTKCNRMDDVSTFCRSRGADGIAFVLQNTSDSALGNAGSGLGYDGIFNALAVEIDTFFNFDRLDSYENHIAVMTNGFRYNLSSNHSRSLATTSGIPDLTEGSHQVRIKYDPNFDDTAVLHPSFQTNGFTSWFVENADFKHGGMGDWGVGFGLLFIYLDDFQSPVITIPMNLDATLKLDSGRMYVGLTAATGDSHYQAHEIRSFHFRSLYSDRTYYPPFVINQEGSHECNIWERCVHLTDRDHFLRKNNMG